MSTDQSAVIQYALTEVRTLLSSVTVREGALKVRFVPEPAPADEMGLMAWVRSVRNQAQASRGELLMVVKGPDGADQEVMTPPPALYTLSIGVVPSGGEYLEVLTAYGSLLRFLQDKPEIPVGPYGWVGHDGPAIPLAVDPGDEALQADAARLAPAQYANLALGISLTVGINSAQLKVVRRVIERKLSAERMPADKKNNSKER